jgi:hypothetical protein
MNHVFSFEEDMMKERLTCAELCGFRARAAVLSPMTLFRPARQRIFCHRGGSRLPVSAIFVCSFFISMYVLSTCGEIRPLKRQRGG